jgi:hypothetical protein
MLRHCLEYELFLRLCDFEHEKTISSGDCVEVRLLDKSDFVNIRLLFRMRQLIHPLASPGLDINDANETFGLTAEQVLLVKDLEARDIFIHVELEANLRLFGVSQANLQDLPIDTAHEEYTLVVGECRREGTTRQRELGILNFTVLREEDLEILIKLRANERDSRLFLPQDEVTAGIPVWQGLTH